MIGNIKGIIDKVASHKLAVTAVAGAAAATGGGRGNVADSGYSDGVYIGPGGGGYLGRVRRGKEAKKTPRRELALPPRCVPAPQGCGPKST